MTHFVSLMLVAAISSEAPFDLSAMQILVPADLAPTEQKALDMFQSEVETRSAIRPPVLHEMPANRAQPILIIDKQPPQAATRPILPEGFSLRLDSNPPLTLHLSVADPRGLLFGLGHLLRKLDMSDRQIHLQEKLDIHTSPKTPLRGHQLGYRPKTNSYDAWDLPQWEQYIRDLAVFGTNAIELIPPKSDDDELSPHFPLPPMEMMVGMSRIADEYGLDVWIWYPALDGDYADPQVVQQSLKEWGEVLSKLPRVDAIFIPTGDPGRTRPKVLMPMLEQQTEQLQKLHPNAKTWISVQGLTQDWWDEMMDILATEPEWLAGVGFGPQTRVSLPRLRAALPARYPIRRYPDITHCMWCQYPVPDWDVAFPRTEGREGVNPRPVDQAKIYRAFDEYSNGFITYSEGCNDDVNKMIWSGLGWDPDADVLEILRDYGRYFIAHQHADDFAQALMALERNWRGPLMLNDSVPNTLAQLQQLERGADQNLLANWRFQQALYRAYYDAYLQARLIHETALEKRAMDHLRQADKTGAADAIRQAQDILDMADSKPVAHDLRARVFDLAEDLYQSIRMQLSVPKYKAIAQWRGANLDAIDTPLNNSQWLRNQFQRIQSLPSESDRVAAIQSIRNWTDPGPGGFYDDLGDPANQPHLVFGLPYAKDPGFLASPYVGFEENPDYRLSWATYVDGLFDVPVVLKYKGLDRAAQYKVRVLYAGENNKWEIRLVANDGREIHSWMQRPKPTAPIEFDIPKSETQSGELTLTWTADPTRGGNGRGVQLAEVWIIKTKPESVGTTSPPKANQLRPDRE